MNNIYIPLLLTSVAGLSTLIGCIFLFFRIKKINEFITFCLSFSFIILLCISIFDLMPSSIYTLYSSKSILKLFLGIISFIIGIISINVLNIKIKAKKVSKNANLYRVGILSMISLLLHNIPEGIAVFMSSYSNILIGIKLCLAITLHNIPEGIIIAIPLYHSGCSKKKTILYTLISALSEPIGGIIGYILFKNIMSNIILSYILLFVAGLMINLAISDILKESISYNKSTSFKYGFMIGLFLFILTLFI